MKVPPVPERRPLPANWPHRDLYEGVKNALAAMPSHFRPEITIAGLITPDLHTLNTPLGATIEQQATETLNSMRSTWDPKKKYATYSFVRQPQAFPDVRLVRAASATGGDAVLMGIEMKGWYVFAKEGMPNFRFQTTPLACAPQDLLVVVPWALSDVISGRPVMLPPYIESARFAAEYRNYHWEHVRESKDGSRGVTVASAVSAYPKKSDKISDLPEKDGGGNFGRVARTGLMSDFVSGTKALPLSGVSLGRWLAFFQSLDQDSDTP